MSTSRGWSGHSESLVLGRVDPSNETAPHSADVAFLHGIASRMAAEVPFDGVLKAVVDYVCVPSQRGFCHPHA
jgi:hypothetical protein